MSTKKSMSLVQDTLVSPVSIFVPQINDYVEICGAKTRFIGNKKYLRIVGKACKTGKEYLFTPSDLERFFEKYGVPF